MEGASSQGRRWERERTRWDAVRREGESVDEGDGDEGRVPAGEELSPLSPLSPRCPHVHSSHPVPGRVPAAVPCLQLCQAALAGRALPASLPRSH